MIQRRRAQQHETKTGHERWLVSYADFITLLFGFFVVMYSVSQVSEQKYRALSDTLATVFEGKPHTINHSNTELSEFPQQPSEDIFGLSPGVNLISTQTLAEQLQEVFDDLIDQTELSVRANEEWLEIDVNANLLFDSGSAAPSAQAERIFKDVAAILEPYDNEIEVAGHTDNVPIRTKAYSSNWELSSARAVSVVKLLSQHQIDPARLSAVGYGEFRPLASNELASGRAKNRRVVLKVARHQAQVRPLPEGIFPNGIPASIAAPENAPVVPVAPAAVVEPVRLPGGGLLFSVDPPQESE